MHKVITMSDTKYFDTGRLFLETRNRVNAEFVCYTPDFTNAQIKECWKHDIEVKFINKQIWELRMQTLTIQLLLEELDNSNYLTFCDFDCFFVNDWLSVVFNGRKNFLGVTTTEGYRENIYPRAKANGGVVFVYNEFDSKHDKSNMKGLLRFALKTINLGGDISLPEYNTIWETLEDPKRPERKRHFRTTQTWWCDQVFLSALVFAKDRFPVKLFPCKKFNDIGAMPDTKIVSGVYIKHLKNAGRAVL